MPLDKPEPRPDLRSDYLTGGLQDLFQIAPDDTASALAVDRRVDRAALAAAIRPHAERLGAPPAALANLERLGQDGSLAVVTGQQAGLLLGPLYTLSKAVTAVRLARRLDSEERPVVPVFWVASQDHDVAEVDHAYLLDASETLRRVEVSLPEGVAVGRIPMREDMLTSVAEAFAQHTPRPAHEPQALELLGETAAISRSFADWFSAQVYRLLGDMGIVIVDPLEPGLAALFSHVIERELDDPLAGPRRVNEAGRSLRDRGYAPQLGRGADATNLFVELEEEGGPPRRHLLRVEGGAFSAGGRRLSRADLKERLRDDPTSVTPAAGLRPIVQDALLPTAASVLGPGELAYVAQLRGVYELHDVPMPLVWPRASATVVEPAASRMLAAHGLSASGFAGDAGAALSRTLLERHGMAGEFSRATSTLERAFEDLLSSVDAIDPTLRGTVKRGRRHLQATVDRLRDKSSRALSRRDGETRRHFERLAAHLLPFGQPAERVLSPYSHFLKFGFQPLLDRLEELTESGHHDLHL